MKLVSNKENLTALMQKVKEGDGSLVTNFFADPEKLSRWFANHLIFVEYTECGLLIFRRDNSFFHLYYYTTSLEKLQFLINNHLPTERLVVDVIGKPRGIKNLINLFNNSHFKVHKQLQRYIRINAADSMYHQKFAEVSLAVEKDAKKLSRLFLENFDKLSEQVPSFAEIEMLIEEKKVLVVKDEETIKGFLVRTFNGQTTILNNFLVDAQFRGERIGSKLLKHYIFESRSAKRMILWVVSDNRVAIKVYRNHGYVEDDLIDCILINN